MSTKVCVINFKGGVGKTTLTIHLATYLASVKKKKVLVIDIDHQSSLSIVLLGGELWEQKANENKTINRLFESYCKRTVAIPGNEIIIQNPFHLKDSRYNFYPNLDMVPAQFELDNTEIELASTTIGSPTYAEWEKRTLIASWLDKVKAHEIYDYIIYDCPPATKLVSQNAVSASDFYIIPVIPDEMSSRGVSHFQELVKNNINQKLEFYRKSAPVNAKDVPINYVPSIKLAGIVPFMVKSSGRAISGIVNIHTRQMDELQTRWGDKYVEVNVKNMVGVPESIESGWPVWNTYVRNATPAVKQMMTTVCENIYSRLK
jgi:chromosome partitioning protein